MQAQHGRLTIPRECYTETTDPRGEKLYEPWTPYVWAAFLTGKLPTEIGLSKETVVKWDKRPLHLLRALSIKVGLHRIRNKRRVFEKLGFKRRRFSLEDHRFPTIFTYATSPCIINVPTVSEEWGIELEGKNFNEMLRTTWLRFYSVRKSTLRAVKEGGWDLLMSYTRLLDVTGELCFGNFKELFKAYGKCNEFVSEIKSHLDPNHIFLIVSDHGMERFGNTRFGKHSNHAFYSLNVATDWKPRSVLDFHKPISKWLARNSNLETSRFDQL